MTNESKDRSKGRFKRLGVMTVALAVVILTALSRIYDKVDPASLATAALLLAMPLAAILNYFYERRKS